MEKNKDKLPMLISVPHGGNVLPNHFNDNCLLSERDILLDGDTWTKELYDFRDMVEEYIYTDIARVVVDMNRKDNDLPPKNPDGVIKSIAVNGKQVWKNQLSSEEIDTLINKYYKPYHHRLEDGARNPKVKLAIDCHSMLDIGPTKDRVRWERRPLFCISNRGDKLGDKLNEQLTAPPFLMQKLKVELDKKFKGYGNINKDVDLVSINEPFKGGHITTYHGRVGHVPWIQLEINRRLYLPTNEKITLEPNAESRVILKDIMDKLYDVFKQTLALF